MESRDQLQLEDGAAEQERCFDDGGAPSKVHKRMWTHRWEYTAFSYQKVDNIQTQCESRNQPLLTLAPPIWPIEGQQIGKTDSLACV